MNTLLNFRALVELCQETHALMQGCAARTVDVALVARNWLFGRHIVEFEQKGADRAAYGEHLIRRLSAELRVKMGKGFSERTLEQCRKFYTLYQEIPQTASAQLLPQIQGLQRGPEIPQTVSAELFKCFGLGWSHYVALLTIDNPDERRFYEIEAVANNWSVRELERQIASSLYERLALSRDREEIRNLSKQGLIVEKAADLIKNPLVLEFLGLEEKPAWSENDLETAIIDRLETFLLELGKGFLFEARQKRFTFDNDHFYIDLVFYNRLLRCYVLIDLKRDKLTHQDLGQMQMYVNYFERHVKLPGELPTIGIVLCHRKNDALVELTLPPEANIFASKYQLYLPSKEELKSQLEKIEADFEEGRE
jgi:predicted nuclease of restriction endonuclease-like (RecB) superfamily